MFQNPGTQGMGMPQFNPMMLLMNRLMSNPRFANNPMAQQALSIIQSGDSQKGEEMAMNILQSYGLTKEQGIQQAQNGMANMFGGMRPF